MSNAEIDLKWEISRLRTDEFFHVKNKNWKMAEICRKEAERLKMQLFKIQDNGKI